MGTKEANNLIAICECNSSREEIDDAWRLFVVGLGLWEKHLDLDEMVIGIVTVNQSQLPVKSI